MFLELNARYDFQGSIIHIGIIYFLKDIIVVFILVLLVYFFDMYNFDVLLFKVIVPFFLLVVVL